MDHSRIIKLDEAGLKKQQELTTKMEEETRLKNKKRSRVVSTDPKGMAKADKTGF